jgi:Predicted metal binding domain
LPASPAQFADPAVSRTKFEAEVAEYLKLRGEYERRGWLLVEADFPTILVVMATPGLRPPAIVCGVLFDYTNYDARPPSVRLVDPFTREPYKAGELPTVLNRALPAQTVELPGLPAGNLQMQGVQPLMQAHGPDEVPFLCIAGVREYHEHPGHTGDAWELHRSSGAGRLVRLLEVVHRYGVEPVTGYSVQLVPTVGLEAGQPPA